MTFDVAGARKAGYSDDEIADYLASDSFDSQAARQAGYSSTEIIDHLLAQSRPAPKSSPVQGIMDETSRLVGGRRDPNAKAVGALEALSPSPRSVMDAELGSSRSLIEQRGGPVTAEYRDAVGRGMQTLPPEQRELAASQPGVSGSVAAAAKRDIDTVSRGGQTMRDAFGTSEERAQGLASQGVDPQTARSMATTDVMVGRSTGKPNAASEVQDEPFSQSILRHATDLGLSTAQIPPTVLKGLADIARLATADTTGTNLSTAMQADLSKMTGAKSAAFRLQLDEFQRLSEQGEPGAGVRFLLANPEFALNLAIPSAGSMAIPLAAGAGTARFLSSEAAQAVRWLRNADDAKKAAVTDSVVNATIAAQNAGDTFSETKGDLSDRYTAAAIAGAGSALIGKATGGGVEGQLVREMAGRVTPGVGAAARVAGATGREFLQETGEGTSQSAGQQVGETGGVDPRRALSQGAEEGVLGAMVGGGVSVATTRLPTVSMQSPDSPTAQAGIRPVEVPLVSPETRAQQVMGAANERALTVRAEARRNAEVEAAQEQRARTEEQQASQDAVVAAEQAAILDSARQVLSKRSPEAGENAMQAALRQSGLVNPTEPDPSILDRQVKADDIQRADPETGSPAGPFTNAESAQIAIRRAGLESTHVAVPVEGGYVARQVVAQQAALPRAAQPPRATTQPPSGSLSSGATTALPAIERPQSSAEPAIGGAEAGLLPQDRGAQEASVPPKPAAPVQPVAREDAVFDETLPPDSELLGATPADGGGADLPSTLQMQPEASEVTSAATPQPSGPDVQTLKQAVVRSIGRSRAQLVDFADTGSAPEGSRPLISSDIEGWYDPTTKRVTILLANIRPITEGGKEVMSAAERATWVAWHELSHRGVDIHHGKDFDAVMTEAGTNVAVDRLAQAIRSSRPAGDQARRRSVAIEEALVELAAAAQTGNYDHLEQRYGVRVPPAQRSTLAGTIARIAERLREIISKVVGRPVSGMSDAQVFRLVAGLAREERIGKLTEQARGYVEPSIDTPQRRESRAPESDANFAADVLAELAQYDELFRYPVSDKTTLDGVMAEVFPRAEYLGEDTRLDEQQESGAEIRHLFRTPEGKNLYVFERGREVWLDISRLEEGERGAGFYAAVMNYAHNAKKRFIGDPAGLSEAAVVRRTSAMLSSALRFGTTRHLDAAPEQIAGNPEKGIAPLRWQGDDVAKTKALIETFLSTLYTQYPALQGYSYDFRTEQFTDRSGRPVGADRFADAEGLGASRTARSGEATLRRGILLKSLVESAGGERPGILAKVLAGGRSLIQQGGLGKLFSRSPSEPAQRPISAARVSDQSVRTESLPDAPSGPAAQSAKNRFTLPEWNNVDAAQRAIQDNLNRFVDIQRAIKEQGGVLDEYGATDIYRAMERMPGRLSAHVESFLEKKVSPMLRLMGKQGIKMGELGEYLYALHAPERNQAIAERNPLISENGSGMSDDEASALVEEYESSENGETFKELAGMVKDINRTKLLLLERSGLMSTEAVDAMRTQYPNYVPLKGFADPENEPIQIQAGNGTGQGFAPNVPVKRAAGRTTRAASIVENLIRDYQLVALAAEKNNVAKYIRNFMLANPDGSLWTVGEPEQRPVQGSDGTIRYQVTPQLGDTEIPVYLDGQRVRLQLKDQVAIEQYRKLGTSELNAVMQAFEGVNNWLRAAYTGKNPAFILVNAIRDLQEGLVMAAGEGGAGLSAGLVRHYPGALKAMYRFERARQAGEQTTGEWGSWIERYRRAGGSTGAGWVEDLVKTEAKLRRELADYAVGGNRFMEAYERSGGGAKGVAAASGEAIYKLFDNKVFDYIEALNGATENAARLSVFRAAVEQGMPTNQAASIAKNLTLNFNRKGDMTRFMGALYLFFNPAVQGTKRLYDALSSSTYRSAVWTAAGSVAALGYAMGMLGFMMSGEDDEERLRKFGQIPDYEKERNMVIPLGEYRLTIPLAYGLSFFYNIGQAIADIQNGVRDPTKAAYGLASAFVANFSPLEVMPRTGDSRELIMNMVPTALQPGVQAGLNIAGHGGPLFPEFPGQEDRPDSQKVNRATKGSAFEKTAQALNELTGGTPYRSGWIDVSPETLKMTVRHFAGGAGQFIFDSVASTTDGARFGETEVSNVPVLKAFLKERTVRDTRRQFYELLKEADKAKRQLKLARDALREADDDELADRYQQDIDALQDEQRELLDLGERSRKLRKVVADLRDEAIAAQIDPNLKAFEKRRIIRQAEEEEKQFQDDVAAEYFEAIVSKRRAKAQ